MANITERMESGKLPVYPLDGAVLFPSLVLTLETTDESLIRLCEKTEKTDGKLIAVPHLVDGNGLCMFGTVCHIERTFRISGGAIKVVLVGEKRAEISTLERNSKISYAEYFSVNYDIDDGVNNTALVIELNACFEALKRYLPKVSDEMTSVLHGVNSAGELADYIASYVFVNYEDKLKILAENDPYKRAELAAVLLLEEKDVLEAQMNIHQHVKEALDQNQRDFVLKEQLKAIKDELGMDDEDDDPEIAEYMSRIKTTALPEEVAVKLKKEVKKLAKMPYASAESSVERNYLDAVLDLPWGKRTKDRTDVKLAKKILDADHDGLDKIKERILEFIAARQLNPDIKNQIICLIGPPGTGKTSIAISLARALKRNYVRVSLGGVRDEADIRGHRKTYIGSMPGRIIEAITDAKSVNPLILLDEVDKLTSDAHGDPSSALLEVLDSEQNKAFRDHFIEVPFDLSECMFIATANDISNIPKPLLDRMEVIELKIYTRYEKLSIAKNHLIPKQLKKYGLNKRSLKIDDSAILEIVDFYTAEAGVRNLEREIASLCRKVARKIVEGEGETFKISSKNLSEYLGQRKIIPDKIYDDDEIGVVNGLAYTEVGGDLLRIEAASVPGNGKLELTGSLGDVMKESAKAAITYIRSHSSELGVDGDFYKNSDIHIHVPEGAVPKDGPSAGVTIVTALASELSGKPVRRDIAMTGEVTLRGRVLAIGGLKEKTMAAYKAGVKKVFIPWDNTKDLSEVDKVVRDNIEFVPCKTVDQVLNGAILR